MQIGSMITAPTQPTFPIRRDMQIGFRITAPPQPTFQIRRDMQIGSMNTDPTQPTFRIRRAPGTCRVSPLNPLRKALASAQTLRNPADCILFDPEGKRSESTRTHIFNIVRLLQKSCQKDTAKPSPENRWKSALDGLNLAGIWPGSKKAEQMSPRHLNNLQRLLSRPPDRSPRNHLGNRWPEYHGCNDWAGLLDPLDENLRREVVRYGEFVQAAYHGFHSNPATSVADGPVARHIVLPDKSYRVTKSLYATSSVGLPGWVDDMAPQLGWMTQRSSWIGYVAVCENEREIARMGRRDIVISLRGTATCLEWAENLRAGQVGIPTDEEGSNGVDPKVECGFWSLYKSGGPQLASLSEMIVEEIQRLLEHYKGEPLSITVTGHSLGAALALLAADELSTCAAHVPPIAVFSFGGPRVGNRGFANRVKRNGVKVLRIVNSQDLITRVPGMFGSEDDQPNMLDDMPWAYSHVGSELKVDSRSSPYLKPNADVACCHDLEAYLHLVDGFLASNCPFRANAKRSLERLLHEQGSNVKKLYTSNDLTLNVERGVNVTPNCLASPS